MHYEMLKSLIRKHDEVIIAYLYGSAAQGNLQADRDIDIGILLADDAVPDHLYAIRLAGEIRSRCHLDRAVDVRILNRRPIRFLRYGEIVFVRDERKRVDFETGVIKEYLDFKPFLMEYDRKRRRRLLA